jgi:hypothetical protein
VLLILRLPMDQRVPPSNIVLAIAAAVLVSVLAFSTGRARACSISSCNPPIRLFGAEGMYVPGDLVYFKVLVDDPGTLLLRTANGEPIEASIRIIGNDRVFAPTDAIAPETDVVLEYTMACAEPVESSYAFITTEPAASQPPSEGLLMLFEHGVNLEHNGQSVFQRIRYFPPGNPSASYLATHELTIDGVTVSLFVKHPSDDGAIVFDVATSCVPELESPGEDSCGDLISTLAGDHEVVAQTTIVGIEQQPEPFELHVTTSCAGADFEQFSEGERESPDASTGAAPVRQRDAGDDDRETEASDARASGGSGCAVAAPGSAPGTAQHALVLVAAMLQLRRRLRRSARAT